MASICKHGLFGQPWKALWLSMLTRAAAATSRLTSYGIQGHHAHLLLLLLHTLQEVTAGPALELGSCLLYMHMMQSWHCSSTLPKDLKHKGRLCQSNWCYLITRASLSGLNWSRVNWKGLNLLMSRLKTASKSQILLDSSLRCSRLQKMTPFLEASKIFSCHVLLELQQPSVRFMSSFTRCVPASFVNADNISREAMLLLVRNSDSSCRS